MFSKEIENKFLLLRELVFSAIAICLQEDSHCKHYEGTFEIGVRYPNYFEEKKGIKPVYTCSYACYLICEEGRGKDWEANSCEELYKMVESDIINWIFNDERSFVQNYEDTRELESFKPLWDEFDSSAKHFKEFNV